MLDDRSHFVNGYRIALCIACALSVASCTVQNSGSVAESIQSAGKKQGGGTATEAQSLKLVGSPHVLRADYLRPIEAIKNPIIVVEKEKRRLYLFDRQVLVRDYPIALGSSPVGDKERSDDGRTPEGKFFISGKADQAEAGKYFVISYQGRLRADWSRLHGAMPVEGAGSVPKTTGDGEQASTDYGLGGGVGIRGGGAHGDWTDGSVALYDSDMTELYKIAQLGTPVHIRP